MLKNSLYIIAAACFIPLTAMQTGTKKRVAGSINQLYMQPHSKPRIGGQAVTPTPCKVTDTKTFDITYPESAQCYDEEKGFIACSYFYEQPNNILVGYIDLFNVTKKEQGHGIGTLLLQSALQKFKELGCEVVTLEAEPTDAKDLSRLINFYKRHGFTTEEPITKTTRSVLMQKILASD